MSSYIGIPNRDNTTLFSGTITTTGIGSTLDLTGYDTALVQVTGIFSGIITFERSLDNVNWFAVLVTELNALNQKTQIETTGIYSIRGEAQYLRYNITNLTGSVTLMIDGNQNIINAADKVAWAMDESNNTPLNIRLQAQNSGIKQDLSGAFILSDAPTAVQVNLTATQNTIIIDTTGYQSLAITSNTTLVAAVSGSNDGITFNSMIGYSMLSGLSTSAIATGGGNYSFPCITRYIRVIASVGGQFTYYLRSQPFTNNIVNVQQFNGATVAAGTAQLGMNMVQVGGTTTVTGGLVGTLGVGGSTAVGIAPTSNPIIAGGIDPGGLGRRLAADAFGTLFVSSRVVPSSTAALGTSTQAPVPVTLAGFNNQVALSVQDTMQFESQNHVELLGQILQEMKIMNQQLYELPRIMAAQMNGYNSAAINPQPYLGDEPTQMRNDASLFINQQ